MKLTGLDCFVWAAGFAGHLLLLCLLLSRSTSVRFPMFTALIGFNVVRTALLCYLHSLGISVYFYSYWSLALVDTLLQLTVFVEVALKIFRPSGMFSSDIKKPLLSIAPCSVCVAAFVALLALPPVQDVEQAIVIRGELFSTVMMSQLFVGLLVLSVTSGFAWKTEVGVIAKGLGVFSTLSLSLQGLKAIYGAMHAQQLFKMFSQIQVFLYLACLTYWIVGLSKRATETKPLPNDFKLKLVQINASVASLLCELRLTRGSS